MNAFIRPFAVSRAVVFLFSLTALSTQAATIVGGSDLLTSASANQLESWLGSGPIQLTNIFDKKAGDTSLEFHAASDGKGATFSLVEVTGFYGSGSSFATPVIIGGYNPQSWNSSGSYNYTPSDAERTAFVFNLTQGTKFDQRLVADDGFPLGPGSLQTYNNNQNYGPTFGGGYDIAITRPLNSGVSFLYSYGDYSDYSKSLVTLSIPNEYAYLSGRIEIFTVSAVPEPQTYALMLAGLGVVGSVARRRQRPG